MPANRRKIKVNLLLKLPYDPETLLIISRTNYTPLFQAIINQKNVKTIEEILNTGEKVNYAEKYFKNTALHFAVKSIINMNSINIIKLLLKRGANVDSKNQCGQTPLSVLVECSKINGYFKNLAIYEFIFYLADVNSVDKRNHSVLDVAFYSVSRLEFKLRDSSVYPADHLDNMNVIETLLENGSYPHIKHITRMVNLSLNTKSFFCCQSYNPNCICNYRLRILSLLVMKYSVMKNIEKFLYTVKREFETNLSILLSERYEYFHENKREACNFLSKECDEFIKQLAMMDDDLIDDNLTLFEFISLLINENLKEINNNKHMDTVFYKIVSNIYPSCNDILRQAISRDYVLEKNFLISANGFCGNSNKYKIVTLNIDCMDFMKTFLSKKDILHLAIAYKDIFKK